MHVLVIHSEGGRKEGGREGGMEGRREQLLHTHYITLDHSQSHVKSVILC